MSEFLAFFSLYGRLDATLDSLLGTSFALGDGIRKLGRLLRSDIIYLFIKELDY